MPYYTGTILKVNPKGQYGWIGKRTVVNEDGTSIDLNTTKDIFLHSDDCDSTLRVGMKVKFSPIADTKREQALRAIQASETEESKFAGKTADGIDLHIDERVIDNPGVRMRWCVSPTLHARVLEGLRAGKGYAVMLVARKQRGDDMGTREIREVKDYSQPFTIITFPKPGEWKVDIILFERQNQDDGDDTTNSLLLGLRHHYLKRKDHGYRASLPAVSDINVSDTGGDYLNSDDGGRHYRSKRGSAISVNSVKLSLPNKDIFAKEPSQALKTYGNYFFRSNSPDECDLRRRLMIMIPGFVPWVLLECCKRILHLLLSLIYVLFCVKGSGKAFVNSFAPAIDFYLDNDLMVQKNFEKNDAWDGYKLVGVWEKRSGVFYTPGALIGYLLLVAIVCLLSFGAYVAVVWLARLVTEHWIIVLSTITVLGLLFGRGLYRFISGLGMTYDERQARSVAILRRMTIQSASRRALLAKRHETALVCGDAPAEIELKAIPAELRTFGMWFRNTKRNICRPFA